MVTPNNEETTIEKKLDKISGVPIRLLQTRFVENLMFVLAFMFTYGVVIATIALVMFEVS